MTVEMKTEWTGIAQNDHSISSTHVACVLVVWIFLFFIRLLKKKEGRICVEDLPSLKYNRTYHRIFSGENALVYLFLESWRAHKRNPSFENSKLREFQPLRISLNFLEWTRVRKQVKYCRFKTKTKEYYQTCWLYSWVADFRAPFPSLG